MILRLSSLALFGFILLFSNFLVSCQQSASLSSIAPASTQTIQPLPAPPLSTINLPVNLTTSVLEKILNEQLSGVVYQDDDITDDDLAVKVTKTGKLRLKAEFSKLYVEVPLHVWAKGRWQWNACELCKSLQKSEETEFDLVVRTESRLQVLPTYQLKSYTSGDFTWGERKPTLKLGPLNFNLAPILEPKMKAQLAPMLQQLDQELQKQVNLKSYLTQAWQQLQEPVSIHDAYQAWLSIEPKAIRLTPLELQNNQLSLQVGVDAFLTVTTGQKPNLKRQPQLPAFTSVRTLPQEAQIQVTSDISYDYLTKLLQKELNNKTFTFEESRQLTVHDVVVSASNNKLLLALDLSGQAKSGLVTKKFQGKVYLQGTPYYEASSQNLKVKDVEYELKTRDQLVKTANWLLGNKFRSQLEQQMTISVKEQLTSTRQALQSSLTEKRLHEHVLLRGTVQAFQPDTLLLTPTSIRALFNATSKMSLSID